MVFLNRTMIDIKDLREKPGAYKANNKRKARDVGIVDEIWFG